jgi:hypothetical protein
LIGRKDREKEGRVEERGAGLSANNHLMMFLLLLLSSLRGCNSGLGDFLEH